MMMTLDPHHPIDFCPKADKLEVMKRATHRHEERRSEVDIAWTTSLEGEKQRSAPGHLRDRPAPLAHKLTSVQPLILCIARNGHIERIRGVNRRRFGRRRPLLCFELRADFQRIAEHHDASPAERPGQEAELSTPTKDRPPRIRRPPHNLTVQRPRSAIVKPTPRRGVAAPGLQLSAPSSGSPPFYRFSAVTLRNGAIVESILAEEFCGLLSVNEGTKPDPDLARCASALAMR